MFGAIFIIALAIFIVWLAIAPVSSQYPDGKCYLCRKGHCAPGETCPNCGTDQPLFLIDRLSAACYNLYRKESK